MDLSGSILISMPGMGDPRFERTVILICAHSPEGAMGLIINKPAPDLDFSALLDHLDIPRGLAGRDIRVHLGGPVERGRGFVLHSPDYASNGGTLDVAGIYGMTATLDILQDLAQGRGPCEALLALGYAGWGPGQLEAEIGDAVALECGSGHVGSPQYRVSLAGGGPCSRRTPACVRGRQPPCLPSL